MNTFDGRLREFCFWRLPFVTEKIKLQSRLKILVSDTLWKNSRNGFVLISSSIVSLIDVEGQSLWRVELCDTGCGQFLAQTTESYSFIFWSIIVLFYFFVFFIYWLSTFVRITHTGFYVIHFLKNNLYFHHDYVE